MTKGIVLKVCWPTIWKSVLNNPRYECNLTRPLTFPTCAMLNLIFISRLTTPTFFKRISVKTLCAYLDNTSIVMILFSQSYAGPMAVHLIIQCCMSCYAGVKEMHSHAFHSCQCK